MDDGAVRKALAAFVGVLMFCACAAAQSGGGWAAVEGIAPGSQVEVRSRAATVKGTFISASSSGIDVLTPNSANRHIEWARVTRVYLKRKSHALRKAAVWAGAGAGVGFAGGFALGYVKTAKYESLPTGPEPNDRVGNGAAAGAFFAVIGAAVGAVIGRFMGRSRTLIYERSPGGGRKAPAQKSLATAAGMGR